MTIIARQQQLLNSYVDVRSEMRRFAELRWQSIRLSAFGTFGYYGFLFSISEILNEDIKNISFFIPVIFNSFGLFLDFSLGSAISFRGKYLKNVEQELLLDKFDEVNPTVLGWEQFRKVELGRYGEFKINTIRVVFWIVMIILSAILFYLQAMPKIITM